MVEVKFFLSLSILFPLLTGLFRRRVVLPTYFPVLLLFLLGVITELVIAYSIRKQTFSWIPANNFYVLLESLLIPVQFYTWGYLRKKKAILYAAIVIFLFAWITEHLVYGNLYHLHPYFRMFYSLMIVLFSINTINYLVVHEERNLVRHPVFIFCTAFIIFFTYQLVYEGTYSIVKNIDQADSEKLNTAFSIINFVCNILYGLALLLVNRESIKDWFSEKMEK